MFSLNSLFKQKIFFVFWGGFGYVWYDRMPSFNLLLLLEQIKKFSVVVVVVLKVALVFIQTLRLGFLGEIKIKAELIAAESDLGLSLAILLNKIVTNNSPPNWKCLKRVAGIPEKSKKN